MNSEMSKGDGSLAPMLKMKCHGLPQFKLHVHNKVIHMNTYEKLASVKEKVLMTGNFPFLKKIIR